VSDQTPDRAPDQVDDRTRDRAHDRAPDLARDLAGRVEACPDVAGLSAGPFGTVATYLPGGRVSGIAVRDDEVEIAVIARYGRPFPAIADQVRQAVIPLVGERPVRVAIDDVVMDEKGRP
jgi:hypothetical protein